MVVAAQLSQPGLPVPFWGHLCPLCTAPGRCLVGTISSGSSDLHVG
jgi:hypothetical protein